MALQLQSLQAFLPRPPGPYLQVHYFSLPVPQKVFLLSVAFLLLDSFSQYPTDGDIGYWEKLSKVFAAFSQLSVFCIVVIPFNQPEKSPEYGTPQVI